MQTQFYIITSTFSLMLSLVAGGIIALLSRSTRHVKWILPMIASVAGAWLVSASAPWPNVSIWHGLVLVSLLVWVTLDWSPKKLRKESLVRSYGETWLGAVLKSTAVLVGCALVAIASAPHHP